MKYDMEKMIPRGKCLDSFFQAGIGSDKATAETFAEISQFFNVKGDSATFDMNGFDKYYESLSKNKLGKGKKTIEPLPKLPQRKKKRIERPQERLRLKPKN